MQAEKFLFLALLASSSGSWRVGSGWKYAQPDSDRVENVSNPTSVRVESKMSTRNPTRRSVYAWCCWGIGYRCGIGNCRSNRVSKQRARAMIVPVEWYCTVDACLSYLVKAPLRLSHRHLTPASALDQLTYLGMRMQPHDNVNLLIDLKSNLRNYLLNFKHLMKSFERFSFYFCPSFLRFSQKLAFAPPTHFIDSVA